VRDLAAWVTWFIRDLNLPQPLPVIGSSLGGWVAAEIATVNPGLFTGMVLVGAAGLKPHEGQVWDYFINSNREAFARPSATRRRSGVRAVLRQCLDAEDELSESARWPASSSPYVSHAARALGGITTPTLVVWGGGRDHPARRGDRTGRSQMTARAGSVRSPARTEHPGVRARGAGFRAARLTRRRRSDGWEVYFIEMGYGVSPRRAPPRQQRAAQRALQP
jgi:pimeloyl-ACP methyl ester carboxylesterase